MNDHISISTASYLTHIQGRTVIDAGAEVEVTVEKCDRKSPIQLRFSWIGWIGW